MRTVKVFEEAWPLHTPFVIARGSRSEARVVVVELEEEGRTAIRERADTGGVAKNSPCRRST